MRCSACGTENDAAARFCRECGSPLQASCPTCGASVAPGSKFCSNCGSSLTEAARPAAATTASQPAAAAAAERRLVSVVFADLVGFTTYADHRDAEETRELLSRYFATAEQIVSRYGGTIEKFIGDAVMAVWGTPTAHEDDAERAVRAALELVEAVAALGRDNDLELNARGGVMTGEAAVTLNATNQGMVAGDMVNTASRLQSAAQPGTVLVGERTHRATSDAIAYEAARNQELKGKGEPVPAYRALRVVAERGGAGRSEQLEAPFVGRSAELRMLKDLFHATSTEHRPRLVSVIGQAGIGKSRLAWEFQKYIDGLTEIVFWHRGRCPAYGEGVSFWALGEMVRARIGLAEGEGPEAGLERLDQTLADVVKDDEERAWLRPALAELLGFETGTGTATSDTLFAAWRTFFERLAESGTVALVFEDLQWADPGLLDFIEHVLEWARNQPIFIVTLARPELFDRRPDWGAGWRGLTSLTLEPLTDAAMRELLDGLVPGLPESARDRILERAEGVPLYAIETVRKLLAEGRIEPVDGTYRPTGDLTELSVPESLHALVAARLDALDGPMRTLVQEASVLGKTFSAPALAGVAERDPAEIEPILRDLVHRELFSVDADPRSPERGQYGFVQSVIREVAYGTLSRRERRRLHLAAARHLESLEDEEISGALAEHYVDAYRARPEGPEGAAVASQARLALKAAAERASRLRSFDLALHYLEQALEVARDDADRAELRLLAGQAAGRAGEPLRAREHSELARDLFAALGDREEELRAIAAIGMTRIVVYEIDEALPPLLDAASRFADVEDSAAFAQLADVVARGYMRSGRAAEAIEWCDRGLPIAERHGEKRVALEMLNTRGTVLGGSEGRMIEAVATLRGVRAIAADLGFLDPEARACVNLGFVLGDSDPAAAFEVSREGAELAFRMGLGSTLSFLLSNMVDSGMRIGRWDVLAKMVLQALDLNLAPQFRIQLEASLAKLEAFRGEEYGPRLDRLRAVVPAGDPQLRTGARLLFAEITLAEGDMARVAADSASIVREAPEAYVPPIYPVWSHAVLWSRQLSQAREVLATWPDAASAPARLELEAGILALEGRADEAAEQFVHALQAFADLGATFDRTLCQLSMAAVLPVARRDVA
ncbi:MAG TPA: adenylate/guanylate cyclase domain-containing protein, partial [Candidatus Limnocylindria bacterium]|nr:adenylate/guanylate cyclase domain-containing protein [Candidatus Limnocylindria bacterium]